MKADMRSAVWVLAVGTIIALIVLHVIFIGG